MCNGKEVKEDGGKGNILFVASTGALLILVLFSQTLPKEIFFIFEMHSTPVSIHLTLYGVLPINLKLAYKKILVASIQAIHSTERLSIYHLNSHVT